jgi:tetratricopeptide (TPR) repeat protein
MGYEYIDGPSDSLLSYFGNALEIINNNLEKHLYVNNPNYELIKLYRNYKIRVKIEFGIEYFFRSDYPKALGYYYEALEEAKLQEDVALLSECYSEIGIVYKNQGKYDLALEYYDQALTLAKQTTDSSWVASCQVNIGNVYKVKGYLTIAQKYYMDALHILEPLKHDKRISQCYQNIGDIYHKQRDFKIALEYYSKSLELAKKHNYTLSEFTCYLNIGYVYVSMGKYVPARDFLNRAITLFEESGYQHEIDNAYILLGDTYFYEEDFNTAIEYYNKALQISMLENDKTSLAEIKGKLGQAYLQTNNPQKALHNFQNSLEEADSIGSLILLIDANLNLSEFYETKNQSSKAIVYYKEYCRLKDSLFNAEKYKSITEMEVKYQTEKRENEMALLTERNEVQKLKLDRRNRVYFTSLTGIGLILIIAYILLRNRQLRATHKSIELEQKLMRSQMNPHFIFNSLIAIQSYIYKQEAVKAGDYLARFAELIRITLENSKEEFVLLEKEIKMLKAYLELQNLRFEHKFEYKLSFPEENDPTTILIPPMMAQPFIENSIEHGLRHRKTKGFIKIKFIIQDNYFICKVEDNGVGREKSKELNKKKDHKSMATSITKERLRILSRKGKQKFTLNIIDLFDDQSRAMGTKVVFNIPFKKI